MAQLIGPSGGPTNTGIYNNGSSAHGAAPDSWWDQLQTSLQQAGADRLFRIILNRLGSAPDDGPSAAAQFVESGGIWIDWCDWPWYYEPGGAFVRNPGTGFSVFNTQGLGDRIIPLYNSSTVLGAILSGGGIIPGASVLNRDIPFGWSGAPWAGLVNSSVYPYNRGLVTLTATDTRGIAVQGKWMAVNYATPQGGTQTIYIYSQLDIPAGAGNGRYFYAAVSNSFFGADTNNAVPPSAYIPWIIERLGLSPAPVAVGTSSPTTTVTVPSLASTGSPAAGLPTMQSCQGQVFSTALGGHSLPCVKTIQARLNQLINAGLAVDGYYGPLTQAAVEEFQRQQGITVDGIVGPQTWGKLENPSTGPARAAVPVSHEQQAQAGTSAAPTVSTTPASTPPASSTRPATGTILGLPTGEVELGAVILVAGLLALMVAERG